MSRFARVRRAVVWTLVVFLGIGVTTPAEAYLTFGSRSGSGLVVPLKWGRMPIQYFVSNGGAPGVTASQFQAAVDRAAGSWQGVSSAEVSFRFGGFTSAVPDTIDGLSTLGFEHHPEFDRVLAATSFIIDVRTGELVESDIFFNTASSWSVAAGGEPGRFDVESIAVHELGHLLGLGHSALGETEIRTGGRRVVAAESVMFPIAFSAGTIQGRFLRADDIAGISGIYPSAAFDNDTGAISGRVTRDGTGVYGAHLVAFNPATGALVGGFSLSTTGQFTIGGLSPGLYVLRVEPLDDADLESFFDSASAVDVSFRVSYLDRLVVVPRGGAAPAVDVSVLSK